MANKILGIKAREILDSRGNPTVECDLKTDKGIFRAMVPSGASTGAHEALELRDCDKSRYGGKGVLKAVENINRIIAPAVKGMDPAKQGEIDGKMLQLDGTENKSKLGANAILAVSMAACKAGAAANKVALYEHIRRISGTKEFIMPIPQMNVINGGKHARINNDTQEQMIVPVGFKSFSEAMRAGVEVFDALSDLLKSKFGAQGTLVGDEGGFVPKIKTVEERLEYMLRAAEDAGYSGKVMLALDCAASEFYQSKSNNYVIADNKFSSGGLVDFYAELCRKFNIISIEDGMAENDWDGWVELTRKLGKKTQIVGDDLLVTNPKRINMAIEKKACNALLLKLNQIGTVSESMKSCRMAFAAGWNVIVSHRSGETEDSFIADLVVGLDANQCKFGGPSRSERLAKYNQLLRIEEELGKKARYAGVNFRKP